MSNKTYDKNNYFDLSSTLKNTTQLATGVPANSGTPITCNVEESRPLPCIVILIHGVNDIGEAYENLDKGICEGLNKRLGRSDLHHYKWSIENNLNEKGPFSPRIKIETEWNEEVTADNDAKHTVHKKAYSPIIPFFWGYSPATVEAYQEDQLAYKERLEKNRDPEIPYDSYRVKREVDIKTKYVEIKEFNNDQFGNWADYLCTRNGGPFSNATTCIPDMYGPGLTDFTNFIAKLGSSSGSKAYDNCHRIYLVYAAQRLASLIEGIRRGEVTKYIPINIVAHSQGTLITILANMLLAKKGILPADCVILAHSPYAFEPSVLEMTSKPLGMGIQSKKGREKTFINFVRKMNEMQRNHRVDEKNRFDKISLFKSGVADNSQERACINIKIGEKTEEYNRVNDEQDFFYRDNFGKVYNYFSPNDQVVSLWSVQGMGWEGIPNHIFLKCTEGNLKQRIFSHGHIVGNHPRAEKVKLKFNSVKIDVSDYPDGISESDFNQRMLPFIDRYNKATETLVRLSDEQLSSLKQIPAYKEWTGKFISGFYLYGSQGKSVTATYQLSDAELARNYPEKFYQQVDKNLLNYDCKVYEQSNAPIPNEKYEYAQTQCEEHSTGGLSETVSFSAQRLINGEAIPETMIYQVDTAKGFTPLARHIYYNDLYNKNNIPLTYDRTMQTLEEETQWILLDVVPYYLSPVANIIKAKHIKGAHPIEDKVALQRLVNENKLDRGIIGAYYLWDGYETVNIWIEAYLTHENLNERREAYENERYNENFPEIDYEREEQKIRQETFTKTILVPDYVAVPPSHSSYPSVPILDEKILQRLAADNQLDRGIKSAGITRDKLRHNYIISVQALLTNKELEKRINRLYDGMDNESSHHSGVTMNKDAPAKVMAFDLALGEVKGVSFKDQSRLREWRILADWRHNENIQTQIYRESGILPKEIKELMNYPYKHDLEGSAWCVNDHFTWNWTKDGMKKHSDEMKKEKYTRLTQRAQWPLPEPDIKKGG